MKSLASIVLDKMSSVDETPPTIPEVQEVIDPARKEELRGILSHGVYYVHFTKVNGERTVMECTLDPRLLPDVVMNPTTSRLDNPGLLHVYALDRAGWRSFKIASVIDITKKPEAL